MAKESDCVPLIRIALVCNPCKCNRQRRCRCPHCWSRMKELQEIVRAGAPVKGLLEIFFFRIVLLLFPEWCRCRWGCCVAPGFRVLEDMSEEVWRG